MFTLPEAIAFGTMVLGGSGVAITGICKFRPRKNNKYVPMQLFDERTKNMAASIERIERTQDKIFIEIAGLRK